MGSSAIDQILQIAPPARAATEPVRPTASERPAFQEHLERATTESLPPKKNESVDTEREDLIASDQQRDAASSQEDETLVATESAVAGEEEIDLNLETEQDAVEISDAAIVLDGVQDSTENEGVIAQELPQSTETDSEDSDSEEHSEKTFNTKNENFDESDSTKNSATRAKTKPEPASAEPQKQLDENQVRADEPAENIEVQPEAASKTQQELTGEPVAGAQKGSKTSTELDQKQQTEQSNIKKQLAQQQVQAKVQTEGQGSDSPSDRKKSNQETNPQSIASKSESPILPEESSGLAAENRPTVAASASTPELTAPTAPTPTNLGGEPTNVASRSDSFSTTATAETPTETEPVPTADRARFVNRVGGAIRAAQNRDGEIRLQLRPAELGSLRIEIAVKQGVLTAHLEAETSAARTILLDNLPALRERLAEQEIRIEKFDVDVRDEGRQQPDNPGTEDRKSNRPQQESGTQSQNKEQAKQTVQTAHNVASRSTHVDSLDVSI